MAVNHETQTKSRRMAIMAVDPGETIGFAQMHIQEGFAPPKGCPDHAVIRWKAWQEPVADAVMPEKAYIERTWVTSDAYYRYLFAVRNQIVRQWFRFRRWSVGYYSISPWNTVLVMEDFIPGMTQNRSRSTLSPVYLNMMLYGYLWGHADEYEAANFGPAHVGSLSFVSPSDRGENRLFTDAHLDRAGLLTKPKTRFNHANAATRVGLAFLRKKDVNVPGLVEPCSEPRPEPIPDRLWKPSEYSGPFQLSGAGAYEPGDPSPKMPSRKKARARLGQGVEREKADSLSEDLRSRTGKCLKRNSAFCDYIIRGHAMREDEVNRMAGQDEWWLWRWLTSSKSELTQSAGRGRYKPTERLIRLAKAARPKG